MTFTIEYSLTERTVQRIQIEANTAAEAIKVVEEYEFDNSDAYEVDSLEWSIDSARLV